MELQNLLQTEQASSPSVVRESKSVLLRAQLDRRVNRRTYTSI